MTIAIEDYALVQQVKLIIIVIKLMLNDMSVDTINYDINDVA